MMSSVIPSANRSHLGSSPIFRRAGRQWTAYRAAIVRTSGRSSMKTCCDDQQHSNAHIPSCVQPIRKRQNGAKLARSHRPRGCRRPASKCPWPAARLRASGLPVYAPWVVDRIVPPGGSGPDALLAASRTRFSACSCPSAARCKRDRPGRRPHNIRAAFLVVARLQFAPRGRCWHRTSRGHQRLPQRYCIPSAVHHARPAFR